MYGGLSGSWRCAVLRLLKQDRAAQRPAQPRLHQLGPVDVGGVERVVAQRGLASTAARPRSATTRSTPHTSARPHGSELIVELGPVDVGGVERVVAQRGLASTAARPRCATTRSTPPTSAGLHVIELIVELGPVDVGGVERVVAQRGLAAVEAREVKNAVAPRSE